MAILFASNSLQDFIAGSSGQYNGQNTAPSSTSNGAMLENIKVELYGNTVYFPLGQNVSEIYFSEKVYAGAPTSTGSPTPLQLVSGAQAVFRILGQSNALRPQVWNGTTFVNLTDIPVSLVQGERKMDWYIRLHATNGRIRCKIDGLTVVDYTGPVAPSIMTFDGIRVGSWGSGYSLHGEVVAATENTESMRVVSLNLTSNGFNTEWIGGVTDVNWQPTGFGNVETYPDTTYITPTAPEQTETFEARDIPAAFANSIIKAVVIGGRGNAGDGSDGVNSVNGVVRLSGTNYEKVPNTPIPASMGPFQTIFDTNPATSAPWNVSDINSAEFGYRSKA